MNLAPLLPITQLTEDQALDELVRLTDLRPPDEDTLGVIHWKQENSHRALQLEAHIAHLQRLAGGAIQSPAGPAEHDTQNAPPQHLQPEPDLAPAAKEKKPMATPTEKLAHRVQAFRPALDIIHARLQTAYALLDEAAAAKVG